MGRLRALAVKTARAALGRCPDCGKSRDNGYACPLCKRCTTVCPNMRCARTGGRT